MEVFLFKRPYYVVAHVLSQILRWNFVVEHNISDTSLVIDTPIESWLFNDWKFFVQKEINKPSGALPWLGYILATKKIDSIFKYSKHFKNVNYIFKRVFK